MTANGILGPIFGIPKSRGQGHAFALDNCKIVRVSRHFIVHQAPVAQTMDSAIRRINHYDNSIGFASV